MRSRQLRYPLTLGVLAGGAVFGYASVIERNWFALRSMEVPVLPADAKPLRVLHLSDAHLTPGRSRLQSWIRSLDALDPDLVVNTGDSIAHPQAVRPFLDSLGPLLERPGAFVYGSNDLFSPRPKNPTRYLWRTSANDHRRHAPDLPTEELGEGMMAGGWLDLNNRRGRLKVGEFDIEVGGVHDSHIKRDRYNKIAGPTDPSADLRLGVMHSPEPRILDKFVDDGYELLLAGHTHGGQVCLPWYGTLVTNCGIDRQRARGLNRYPDLAHGPAWLHVSAGCGTSPWAPVRFACRPEATLLTLVPRMG
jgi:predicted MPP superfamily phosphohydrolase